MDKEKKKKGKYDHLLDGGIMLGVGVVFMLIMAGVFGKSGQAIANFFIGSFGYVMYAYLSALILAGVLTMCKVKAPKINLVKLLSLIGAVCMIVALFQVISSGGYVGEGYGEYLRSCYIRHNTAGGCIGGVFVYPILVINYYFAIVFFSLLALACSGVFIFYDAWLKDIFAKKKDKDNGESGIYSFNGDIIANDDSMEVGDGLNIYTVGEVERKKGKSTRDDVEYQTLEEVQESELDSLTLEQSDNDVITEKPSNFFGTSVSESMDGEASASFERALNVLYGQNSMGDRESRIKSGNLSEDEKKELESYTSNYKMEKLRRHIMGEMDEEEEITSEVSEMKDTDIFEEIEPKEDKIEDNTPQITRPNLAEDSASQKFNRYTRADHFDVEEMIVDRKIVEEPSEDLSKDDIDEPKRDFLGRFEPIEPKVEPKEEVKPIEEPVVEEVKEKEPEVEDLTARDNIFSFQDMLRQKAQEREEAKQREVENRHNLASDEVEPTREVKKRAERSDKGGTHNTMNKPAPEVSSEPTRQFVAPTPRFEPVKPEPTPVEEPKPKKPVKLAPYKYPPISLLRDYPSTPVCDDMDNKIAIIEEVLESFKVPAKVINVVTGPAFTRFELQIAKGISVKKVENYEEDIAMALEVKSLRTQIPIPGKNAFGIEIPNKVRGMVGLKSVITSPAFQNNKHKLSFAVGQDCDGENYVADLTKMPHLLIAGATGAGKSVGLNTLICSIIYKYSPEEVKFLLVDPKQVELNVYNGVPHMLIPEAISDKDQTLNLLDWAIEEMELRYTQLSKLRLRNIGDYNDWAADNGEEKMPYIVIVVDEVGDFMVAMKRELEDRIVRLTQKARAAGIILILATQRPSVDVITGIIKANLPSRMAFAVASAVDSKTIIDVGGAEKLLRNGDMLFMDAVASEPVRVQGPFIDGDEVNAICDYIRENNESYFDPEISDFILKTKQSAGGGSGVSSDNALVVDGLELDEKFVEALFYVVETGSVSITKIQRRFGFGFPRAGRIVDTMEQLGYISNGKDSKQKEVLLTMEDFKRLYGDYEIDIK